MYTIVDNSIKGGIKMASKIALFVSSQIAGKFALFMSALLIMVMTVTGCSVLSNTCATVDSIKRAGILKVGVKADVPGFGYLNPATNQYEGLEIDLAKLIAKEFLGNENWVKFVPVTAKTKGAALDSCDVDMVIATFTITESRKLMYNFSTPYYTDYTGIMVRKDSPVTRLADLNGKTIGVVAQTSTQDGLQVIADTAGVKVFFEQFGSSSEAVAALTAGDIYAFSIDSSILNGYQNENTRILTERYSPQPLGIATKLSNKDLAQSIDKLVNTWLNNGTITSLMSKYNL